MVLRLPYQLDWQGMPVASVYKARNPAVAQVPPQHKRSSWEHRIAES